MPEDASKVPAASSTASPTVAEDHCRLKDLPPEIRNYIFPLAMAEPNPIRLATLDMADRMTILKVAQKPAFTKLTGLSLAHTCRQFHKEVMPVFFAGNTFSLHSVSWARPAGPDAVDIPLARMTKLMFACPGFPDHRTDTEPALYVDKRKDKTLHIRFRGTTHDFCTCRFEYYAEEECGGGEIVAEFVEVFCRYRQWEPLCQKIFHRRRMGASSYLQNL
ncbi:hypothetical protein M409DRAFT_24386 [Zasmidium cellare ATCC 36951]|uniref:F-box domain-containing protein n=1 Tax=Zasmidium cellare ATCC 36951 TaxID=1080233 RepID=A0A6A6CFW1_ZASCE|nr:uncharacterized protein M409DRAFT_24386 [Zasmidium cellare ATCC 36951]KAF2165533.1 hypothetical protein M409DRAFT_24386 [Zasmidium cellare ATCC 36951]